MEHQLKQLNQQNNTAFVLGNGRSRLNLNHEALLNQGTVYGCNAIYREFEPHYLIAVDVKMVNEIIAAGYHTNHQVWTNPNKGISTKSNINFFHPHKGWSSGPTALWFASQQSHRKIYIFGFDYHGLNGRFNNVYSNTFNYKKSEDSATFYGNWLSQTEKVIKEFRNIQYVRVITAGSFVPEQFGPQLPNIHHMTYEEFEKEYPGCTYSSEIHQNNVI